MKPTVGIIGGSGPLATVDIEQKILKATKKMRGVLTDQDYYNLVVFNYSSTYDRNDAVFFGKTEPLSQYIDYILSMASLGVNAILLACNTAHMYLPFLKEKTDIPIIDIIEKTCDYCKKTFPKFSEIGLISTTATKEKKLYHDLFEKNDIQIIDIEPSTQNAIMEAIYLIKAGIDLDQDSLYLENSLHETNMQTMIELKNHPHKQVLLQYQVPNPKLIIQSAIEELVNKGCKHIIFGCTEIPLVIPYLKKAPEVHFIDPNSIIAESVVDILREIEIKISQ